jgi:hypothetical protein
MAQKPTEPVPDWLRLQRKIFSRWVNQKLSVKQGKCHDIVDEIKDGLLLVQLVEILSEKPYNGGKMDPKPKVIFSFFNPLLSDRLWVFFLFFSAFLIGCVFALAF